MQEPNFKAQHGVESPPTDAEVADGMRDFYRGEGIHSIYLPYKGCGEVCETCDPRVREAELLVEPRGSGVEDDRSG